MPRSGEPLSNVITAVDTDVLVRLLTGDDPKQAAAAGIVFSTDLIWISKTVLLETNWVLQKLYGFEERGVCEALTRLLGLENVQVEDGPAVTAALEMTLIGIELPDAIHLASRPPGARFASFDRAFVQRAKKAGIAEVYEAGER